MDAKKKSQAKTQNEPQMNADGEQEVISGNRLPGWSDLCELCDLL